MKQNKNQRWKNYLVFSLVAFFLKKPTRQLKRIPKIMKIYFFVEQNMIYINLICISYERNYSKLITILCGIDWMLLCSWTHAEESKRKGEWWKECLMEFQRIWKLNATISNADVLWMSDLWLTSHFQNL